MDQFPINPFISPFLALFYVLLPLLGQGCPAPEPDPVVTITPSALTLPVGVTQTLQAISSNPYDGPFIWRSSNHFVATVTQDGAVTGIAVGEAIISARASVSRSTGNAVVTVVIPPEVLIVPGSLTLVEGMAVMLTATSTDLRDTAFTWRSFDTAVVGVSQDGAVTGLSEGQAVITATGLASGVTAYAVITVIPVADGPLTELAGLGNFVGSLPDATLAPESRSALLLLLCRAAREVHLGAPCQALATLDSFLSETQTLRESSTRETAEEIYNRGRMLLYAVAAGLSSPETCPLHPRAGRNVAFEVHEASAHCVAGTWRFGEPRLLTVKTGGDVYTQVFLPGAAPGSGEPGKPAVPSVRRLVAIPQGAAVQLTFTPQVAEEIRLNLLPIQPEPVDGPHKYGPVPPDMTVYEDAPFTRDASLYARDAFWPATPCRVMRLGSYRDMEMVLVEAYCGQYNPVTDTLRLFERIDCELSFTGGAGTFLSDASLSPFESVPEVYAGAVINGDSIFLNPLLPTTAPQTDGEELLILTHPSFVEAALGLAVWKRAKGIMTNVFEVNDGAGPAPDTNADIDDLIEQRFSANTVRPWYVLLLGDAEFVPCFNLPVPYSSDSTPVIGTDWPYANVDAPLDPFSGLVPDFAVGRIPVDTLQEARAVVDKIIAYESAPPASSTFYTHIALAAAFQCGRSDVDENGLDRRSFIEVSELIRSRLLTKGYQVDRIYAERLSGNYFGDPTPRAFYDGTPLPHDLAPNSGFLWSNGTQDVVDAFNWGSFLMMHRGHGWPGGWVDPLFWTGNVIWNLTNGPLLPVIFSMDCATGLFDNETAHASLRSNPAYLIDPNSRYLAEHLLLKPNGGAVGLLAATRYCPSGPTTALAKGLFDALWPDTIPDFGDAASKRRLGDILNHAKLYMLTQVALHSTLVPLDETVLELLAWHCIGDPTLEIWTADPYRQPLPISATVQSIAGGLRVNYPVEDAVITAYQEWHGDLHPLGRAGVQGGVANIVFVQTPWPGVPVSLSASKPGSVAVRLAF